MPPNIKIDEALWTTSRAGARAGRGFRYQDAVTAMILVQAWDAGAGIDVLIPEGVDDLTMHRNDGEKRVQIKSRHDPRSTFSVSEIIGYLSKIILAAGEFSESLDFAVFLERPAEKFGSSDWHRNMLEVSDNPTELIHSLGNAIDELDLAKVERLLGQSYIVVESEPIEKAVQILASRLEIPDALARLIAHALRIKAGEYADKNYLASPQVPEVLNITDVQLAIDSVLAMTDSKVVSRATRDGLCELVDFSSAVTNVDFYSGVNVVPGHVSAGLVFERPEQTNDILSALDRNQPVLVSGPSGAGKSALTWLAAHATRHSVRWYRVRRMSSGDVPTLLQHARLIEATSQRPVGFVFDDLGRKSLSGWDDFVKEVSLLQGVLVIGSVREEDIFTLGSVAEFAVVRPMLDEDLAQRLWSELSSSGQSNAVHWRESLERSRGLLLEFTHLLTQGERLSQTIASQVRHRVKEHRDIELSILRTVSFVATNGGNVDTKLLRKILPVSDSAFSLAINRLLNEHAIRQGLDGSLGGLHEIRSECIDLAIHEILLVSSRDTIADAVNAIRISDLSNFIIRVMRRHPELRSYLFDALIQRILDESNSNFSWIQVFHGLGVASLEMVAAKWVQIAREAGIEDKLASFTYGLVLAESDLSGIPNFERFVKASAKFSEEGVQDLRVDFYKHARAKLGALRLAFGDAHEFVACLFPIRPGDAGVDVDWELESAGDSPAIADLLELIRSVHEVKATKAEEYVSAFGGTEVLLQQLHHATPWSTLPRRIIFEERAAVAADLHIISNESATSSNDLVVRLCEQMLAADPTAEIAVSNAVGANGEPIGFGDVLLATKRIARSSLPSPARVAWNRAALRAVQRVVEAPSETPRTSSLAASVVDLSGKLGEAAEFYCRAEQPNAKWLAMLSIRELLDGFVQPGISSDRTNGPLHLGDYNSNDPIQGFVSGLKDFITSLVEPKIERPIFLAIKAAELAKQADIVLNSTQWRWITEGPSAEIRAAKDRLLSLREVLGYAVAAPQESERTRLRLNRSSRRHPALPRAVDDAKACGDAKVLAVCDEIYSSLLDHSLTATVITRSMNTDDGYFWPAVDYAVLVKTTGTIDFLAKSQFFKPIRDSLTGLNALIFAPVMFDYILPMAFKVTDSLFPHDEFITEWADVFPYSIYQNNSSVKFVKAIESITTISSIYSMRRPLNADETVFHDKMIGLLCEQIEDFNDDLNSDATDVSLEVGQFLVNACERLKREMVAEEGTAVPIAVESQGILFGKQSEFMNLVGCYRVALIEQGLLALAAAQTIVPDH